MLNLATYAEECEQQARNVRRIWSRRAAVAVAIAALAAAALALNPTTRVVDGIAVTTRNVGQRIAAFALLGSALASVTSACILAAKAYEVRLVAKARRLLGDDPNAVVWAYIRNTRAAMYGATISHRQALVVHGRDDVGGWLESCRAGYLPATRATADEVLSLVAKRCPRAMIGYSAERAALLHA